MKVKNKYLQLELFNLYSNGIGIDWYKSDNFLLLTISFVFIQVTIKFH